MERFGIAATQSQRTDIFRIQRLPPDRYLRLLRIIRAVERRDRRENSGRQDRRSVLTIPFLALGKVYLQAVEPGEVPCRAGKWHSHFLVDRPDITVDPEALAIR